MPISTAGDTASIANWIDVGGAGAIFCDASIALKYGSALTPQLKTTKGCAPFARIAILFLC